MPADELSNLVPAWRAAAERVEIRAGLDAIYAGVAREIESKGPACWASGRCCNFRNTGHLLYATGLETAAALTLLPRGEGRGEGRSSSSSSSSSSVLTLPQVHAAQSRGDCPFLTHNLCGIHTNKPLGCRVYFCDRSAQRWQEELSERALREIRELHDAHGVEYRYAEWRSLLAAFAGEGRA